LGCGHVILCAVSFFWGERNVPALPFRYASRVYARVPELKNCAVAMA
jgi:hypothetical protein